MGQGQSAEAQLRSKAPPPNPIAINSADLRRTSGGSSLSPASLDPSSGLLPNTGIEGHVPHMICKPCSLLFQIFWGSLQFLRTHRPPLTHPALLEHVLGVVKINDGALLSHAKIKRLTCATKLN